MQWINQQRGKIMILDPRVLVSLAGRPWLEKYLTEFDYRIEDIVS